MLYSVVLGVFYGWIPRLKNLTYTLCCQASGDQSILDLDMAPKLGWCPFSVIRLLGTIVVMSQVAWEVFAIFMPVTAACIWYQVSNFTL